MQKTMTDHATADQPLSVRRRDTASQHRVISEFTIATPEICESWLLRNSKNRPVRELHVRKLARDMRAGKWQMTGDPIRFSLDGELLDGQHRLMACVRSGVPFETMVVYGLDPISQDVMDTGRSRDVSDVLALRGLTNARRTSTVLRMLPAYRDGTVHVDRGNYSTTEVMDAFERHPNITKSVALAGSGLPRNVPFRPLAFVHYVLTILLNEPEDADAIVEVMKTGVPAYTSDPVQMLRERLLRHIMVERGSSTTIRVGVAEHSLFHVVNLFRKRQTTGVLRLQKEFVEIDGLNRLKML